MAVIFSAVTVTDNGNQTEFLAGGIPGKYGDLEGWTAFDDFVGEIDKETEVSVNVKAYRYGEGKTFKATTEEVAYFMQRAAADENFLSDHCNKIIDTDFNFVWSPEELFGNNEEDNQNMTM